MMNHLHVVGLRTPQTSRPLDLLKHILITLKQFNEINPKLQFTIAKEKDKVINFLNNTITRILTMYNMEFTENLPLRTTLFITPPVTQ
jgi:hypothetical protein